MKKKQKNKFLCLVDNPEDYGEVDVVDIYPIYTIVNKFIRALRYWHHRSNIKLLSKKIWLGRWKYKIKQYSQIVIFDSIFDYFPLEYIRANNPDCKIHFCFRNRAKAVIDHSSMDRNPCKIRETFNSDVYSYNVDDCNTYSLRYYTQFHNIPKILIDSECDIIRDVYFIGKDKGRIDYIRNLAEFFDQEGVTYLFEIVPDRNKKYRNSDTKFIVNYKKYEDIILSCKKSKCIIEIVGDLNDGITYRAIESIVLRKKLITNYRKIIDSDLYDPDNMFILGHNKASELIEFIHKPYSAKCYTPKIKSFEEFVIDILDLEH